MTKKNICLYLLVLATIVSCGAQKNGNIADLDPENTQALSLDGSDLRSQMLRERGSEQFTIKQILEKSKTQQRIFEDNGYSTVPSARGNHNEIPVDGSSNLFNLDLYVDCGIDTSNSMAIKDRIKLCEEQYKVLKKNSAWSGKNNGVAGEGDWIVVASRTTGKRLMLDITTGLVWTDIITTQKVDFSQASTIASGLCDELNAKNDFSISNKDIVWRLPTRGDFLQADINGSRFALTGTNNQFWTASPYDSTKAWSINQSNGILAISNKDSEYHVRCVGHPLK